MLELYERFTNDRTAVPSANIVRSFKNEDSSLFRTPAGGIWIYPLLFNISMPHHERIILAELRLFMHIQQAPDRGLDCKVTIYKVQEGVGWSREVQREARSRDKDEVLEIKDLEELVTKRVNARDNDWVSFDLTPAVTLWRKFGCANHRLEVHITNLGLARKGVTHEASVEIEINIDRSLGGKHNAAMIVFSDDQSRDHKKDKKELNLMIEYENDLLENVDESRALTGHDSHNTGPINQDELDQQTLVELQSNLIYGTPSRIRRHVKSESCKRIPLSVDFKDIGWDTWIIQPLGYEAYACKGECNPPLTSEVSPTKHAIVQTLLSLKSPERVSRACCVPTKLEPLSLLYHENEVITFNHKYEGMVVAECGCR